MTGDISLTMVADGPPEPPEWKTGQQRQPDRWFRVNGLPTDVIVHVGCTWTEDDSGRRLLVTEVTVAGDRVNTSDLQSLPLGQIGRLLSLAGERIAVDKHGVVHLLDEGDVERPPLTRRRKDESAKDFAKRVASAYRSHAARSGKPALGIAMSNDLPVATVRRWIREARQLGELEPGTRGRAG